MMIFQQLAARVWMDRFWMSFKYARDARKIATNAIQEEPVWSVKRAISGISFKDTAIRAMKSQGDIQRTKMRAL